MLTHCIAYKAFVPEPDHPSRKMPAREYFHPAEAIDDTIEALYVEQGRDRPAMFWLTLLFLAGALAALPLVKVDLSVRARGIVRLPAEASELAGDAASGAGSPVVIEAFLRERDAKFLRPGQRAILQYDAFPYNEWGTAGGSVEEISAQAVRFDQQAVFKVRVQSSVRALRMPDGRTGRISDGMSASVRLVVNRKSLLQLIYQKSEDLFGT
jgi:hypothetical protein